MLKSRLPPRLLLYILCFSLIQTICSAQNYDECGRLWLWTNLNTQGKPQINKCSYADIQSCNQETQKCPNSCYPSRRNTISIVGYDAEIYQIIKNIQNYGINNNVIVVFYIICNGKYYWLGHLHTNYNILYKVLKQFSHYMSVSNEDMKKYSDVNSCWYVNNIINIPSKIDPDVYCNVGKCGSGGNYVYNYGVVCGNVNDITCKGIDPNKESNGLNTMNTQLNDNYNNRVICGNINENYCQTVDSKIQNNGLNLMNSQLNANSGKILTNYPVSYKCQNKGYIKDNAINKLSVKQTDNYGNVLTCFPSYCNLICATANSGNNIKKFDNPDGTNVQKVRFSSNLLNSGNSVQLNDKSNAELTHQPYDCNSICTTLNSGHKFDLNDHTEGIKTSGVYFNNNNNNLLKSGTSVQFNDKSREGLTHQPYDYNSICTTLNFDDTFDLNDHKTEETNTSGVDFNNNLINSGISVQFNDKPGEDMTSLPCENNLMVTCNANALKNDYYDYKTKDSKTIDFSNNLLNTGITDKFKQTIPVLSSSTSFEQSSYSSYDGSGLVSYKPGSQAKDSYVYDNLKVRVPSASVNPNAISLSNEISEKNKFKPNTNLNYASNHQDSNQFVSQNSLNYDLNLQIPPVTSNANLQTISSQITSSNDIGVRKTFKPNTIPNYASNYQYSNQFGIPNRPKCDLNFQLPTAAINTNAKLQSINLPISPSIQIGESNEYEPSTILNYASSNMFVSPNSLNYDCNLKILPVTPNTNANLPIVSPLISCSNEIDKNTKFEPNTIQKHTSNYQESNKFVPPASLNYDLSLQRLPVAANSNGNLQTVNPLISSLNKIGENNKEPNKNPNYASYYQDSIKLVSPDRLNYGLNLETPLVTAKTNANLQTTHPPISSSNVIGDSNKFKSNTNPNYASNYQETHAFVTPDGLKCDLNLKIPPSTNMNADLQTMNPLISSSNVNDDNINIESNTIPNYAIKHQYSNEFIPTNNLNYDLNLQLPSVTAKINANLPPIILSNEIRDKNTFKPNTIPSFATNYEYSNQFVPNSPKHDCNFQIPTDGINTNANVQSLNLPKSPSIQIGESNKFGPSIISNYAYYNQDSNKLKLPNNYFNNDVNQNRENFPCSTQDNISYDNYFPKTYTNSEDSTIIQSSEAKYKSAINPESDIPKSKWYGTGNTKLFTPNYGQLTNKYIKSNPQIEYSFKTDILSGVLQQFPAQVNTSPLATKTIDENNNDNDNFIKDIQKPTETNSPIANIKYNQASYKNYPCEITDIKTGMNNGYNKIQEKPNLDVPSAEKYETSNGIYQNYPAKEKSLPSQDKISFIDNETQTKANDIAPTEKVCINNGIYLNYPTEVESQPSQDKISFAHEEINPKILNNNAQPVDNIAFTSNGFGESVNFPSDIKISTINDNKLTSLNYFKDKPVSNIFSNSPALFNVNVGEGIFQIDPGEIKTSLVEKKLNPESVCQSFLSDIKPSTLEKNVNSITNPNYDNTDSDIKVIKSNPNLLAEPDINVNQNKQQNYPCYQAKSDLEVKPENKRLNDVTINFPKAKEVPDTALPILYPNSDNGKSKSTIYYPNSQMCTHKIYSPMIKLLSKTNSAPEPTNGNNFIPKYANVIPSNNNFNSFKYLKENLPQSTIYQMATDNFKSFLPNPSDLEQQNAKNSLQPESGKYNKENINSNLLENKLPNFDLSASDYPHIYINQPLQFNEFLQPKINDLNIENLVKIPKLLKESNICTVSDKNNNNIFDKVDEKTASVIPVKPNIKTIPTKSNNLFKDNPMEPDMRMVANHNTELYANEINYPDQNPNKNYSPFTVKSMPILSGINHKNTYEKSYDENVKEDTSKYVNPPNVYATSNNIHSYQDFHTQLNEKGIIEVPHNNAAYRVTEIGQVTSTSYQNQAYVDSSNMLNNNPIMFTSKEPKDGEAIYESNPNQYYPTLSTDNYLNDKTENFEVKGIGQDTSYFQPNVAFYNRETPYQQNNEKLECNSNNGYSDPLRNIFMNDKMENLNGNYVNHMTYPEQIDISSTLLQTSIKTQNEVLPINNIGAYKMPEDNKGTRTAYPNDVFLSSPLTVQQENPNKGNIYPNEIIINDNLVNKLNNHITSNNLIGESVAETREKPSKPSSNNLWYNPSSLVANENDYLPKDNVAFNILSGVSSAFDLPKVNSIPTCTQNNEILNDGIKYNAKVAGETMENTLTGLDYKMPDDKGTLLVTNRVIQPSGSYKQNGKTTINKVSSYKMTEGNVGQSTFHQSQMMYYPSPSYSKMDDQNNPPPDVTEKQQINKIKPIEDNKWLTNMKMDGLNNDMQSTLFTENQGINALNPIGVNTFPAKIQNSVVLNEGNEKNTQSNQVSYPSLCSSQYNPIPKDNNYGYKLTVVNGISSSYPSHVSFLKQKEVTQNQVKLPFNNPSSEYPITSSYSPTSVLDNFDSRLKLSQQNIKIQTSSSTPGMSTFNSPSVSLQSNNDAENQFTPNTINSDGFNNLPNDSGEMNQDRTLIIDNKLPLRSENAQNYCIQNINYIPNSLNGAVNILPGQYDTIFKTDSDQISSNILTNENIPQIKPKTLVATESPLSYTNWQKNIDIVNQNSETTKCPDEIIKSNLEETINKQKLEDSLVKQITDEEKYNKDSSHSEIDLGNACILNYVPKVNDNTFTLDTSDPNIYIKGWKSQLRIVKAKLVLETKVFNVNNFMAVIKGENKYDPETVQNIARAAITKFYGNPIVIKGFYKIYKPYAIVCNINDSNLKYEGFNNILWPTWIS